MLPSPIENASPERAGRFRLGEDFAAITRALLGPAQGSFHLFPALKLELWWNAALSERAGGGSKFGILARPRDTMAQT